MDDNQDVHFDDSRFPALLAGARRGDAKSIETLYLELQPRVLRYLRSLEPRHADDLAAEVWLAVAKGIRSFEGDAVAFRGWLFAIARRRLADHRRVAARRPVDHGVPDDLPGGADPADVVLNRLSGQQAVDLIQAVVPGEQAEVLLLRVLGGLDVAEVAKVLERTPNWVRVAQHRGLRRLAVALEEKSSTPV